MALAAKLKRASLAAPAQARRLVTEAASEGRETVFGLQELARGIYRSLIVDQGLPGRVAQTDLGRPPPSGWKSSRRSPGRRFGRELEAALYFVALEAMSNAQKHAIGVERTISLHGPDSRALVLEVHADGPGFRPCEPTGGSGLQNIDDRIAAVDGTLNIDSRPPGAGTWLRAEVPLEAQVRPFQRPANDSRR